MHSYEVEIKSLLGNQKRAEGLRKKILGSGFKFASKNKQLNHYFIGGNLQKLYKATAKYFSTKAKKRLKDLSDRATDFSVRSRDKDSKVFLVVKASVDDSTSSNGVTRIEFEEPVSLTLKKLDALLLKSGFKYQAKWSREREEYTSKDIAVCLDKNAGYGWLAEFEKVVKKEAELEKARKELKNLMKNLRVSELKQARLERMFKHYNSNWSKYYGTNKTFTLK